MISALGMEILTALQIHDVDLVVGVEGVVQDLAQGEEEPL